MAVIQLKDIMKTYIMGDSIVHALDHVNVSIDFGEFTAIMGPSGSGKSTMMRRPPTSNMGRPRKKKPEEMTELELLQLRVKELEAENALLKKVKANICELS